MNCSSNADALSEQTSKSGRVRVLFLSQISTSKRKFALSDDEVHKITRALSTSLHERPPERAAVRLDWQAFVATLDKRFKLILHNLTIGESKSNIAKQIGVSAGRVTQILYMLANKIREFFGENLPDWCWA